MAARGWRRPASSPEQAQAAAASDGMAAATVLNEGTHVYVDAKASLPPPAHLEAGWRPVLVLVLPPGSVNAQEGLGAAPRT